ncbi:MAG TPA: EamA family transporter [Ohtaekwangia sp.]|nr:EamA family transporter [Ohtaekwangia sp.]
MKRELLLAYLALTAVCIIWGTTYLALRIAVVHFPPFLFTALRQTIAGGIILLFAVFISKAVWPSKAHVLRQAIAGFFMISLGNGLVAWAEMYIPSGIAAIICSMMPVTVILINISIHREEKPTLPIIAGVALGLVGIVTIFSEHLHEFSKAEYLAGIAAILIAVIAWAGASIWLKKQNTESNLYINAGLQMFFGGLWLYPVSLVFDNYSTITWSADVIYPFIYLVIFGSIIAYISYSYALRKLPMTIVSLYAYINPLVAVLLGWLILDEKLNSKIGIAFIITVVGIYIVNKGYQQLKEYRTTLSRSN